MGVVVGVVEAAVADLRLLVDTVGLAAGQDLQAPPDCKDKVLLLLLQQHPLFPLLLLITPALPTIEMIVCGCCLLQASRLLAWPPLTGPSAVLLSSSSLKWCHS
jgi:hypothetical protein